MRSNRFDALERFVPLFEAPEPSFEGFLRRRDRKRRNQRVAAGVVAIAVFAVPVWIVATGGPSSRTRTPASTPTGTSVQVPGAPAVDYVIDLNTSAVTPLPDPILRSLGKTANGRGAESQYAISPDGSLLAYVGTGDEGSLQIFIAGIDGTGVRQMTHDPTGATSPAWSPDGRSIAYEGHGDGDVRNLFVLNVPTGESTQVTHGNDSLWGPQFTPDGSSLIFTGGPNSSPMIRTVPVAGGKSTPLIDLVRVWGDGLTDSGNGSLSPDGSLVTFLAGGSFESAHCGPCRFVSNVDGTEMRVIQFGYVSPAGSWSPDGSRIVESGVGPIIVVDIATGDATRVAEGRGAIWLDVHTLLVEV